MNLHSIAVASVFLGIYLLLSAVGRAQEGPGRAYQRAISAPVGTPATVVQPVGPGMSFARPAPSPARSVWVPGRRQRVQERVWVPGSVRRVWVPAVYETRHDLWRRPVRVQIAPGRWQTVQEPGHYELRAKRVWQPGRWVAMRY